MRPDLGRRRPARTATGLVAAAAILALSVPLASAANANVAIVDFVYVPASVTITVGESVTWTNQDSVPHTATARNGSFDTGFLMQGQAATRTLNSTGTFAYYCVLHPEMPDATVVVLAATAPPTSAPTIGTGGTGGTATPSPTLPTSDTEPGVGGWVVLVGGLGLLVLALFVALRARSMGPGRER